MHPILEEIYATGIAPDAEGNPVPVHSHISAAEGDLITQIIQGDGSVRKTLEVGCAYGASSMFICAALDGREGVNHTILDPFQFDGFKGVGVENLRRAGFHFAQLVPERSEYALPLLAKQSPESFDFVFLDGCHTMDHVLLEIFYANRLLRKGGYVVIDDNDMPGVRRAIAYLAQYPAYRIVARCPNPRRDWRATLARFLLSWLPRALWPMREKTKLKMENLFCPSMVALQKVGKDKRHWAWYRPF